MSTPPPPPGQPYQNPQPGAVPPPGQPPTGGGYGAPVPPQHNPYAQTSPGFGPPQPGYYAGQPGAPGPDGAADGSSRGAGRAVLWAVVGAAVASAAWAGGVFLLKDKDSGKPDLRGYSVTKDLCKKADLSAFSSTYPKPDDDPSAYTSNRSTVAQMYCSESPDVEDSDSSSSYSYVYLTVNAELHREADPATEFADNWKAYGDRGTDPSDDYKVTAVSGFGDEAFLLTRDSTKGESSGSREVILAVRDGGLTFSLSWDAYASSLDDDSVGTMPTLDEATGWVKKSTTATMANLK